MRRRRDKLCHHVGLCKGEIERSTDVSDGASCRHGAEGHDLRDMIVSVFAPDIVDHLAAPRVSEVHIDIGHSHALGVQKALEEQPVFHRVNFRDVQRIRHHRACRAAAPGSDGNACAFRKIHKVPHNQEVIGKAHLLDHVDLIFHLRAILGVLVSVALLVALVAEFFQVGQRIVARGKLEFRQVIFAEGKFDVAARSDFRRVFNCLRIRGK